MLTFDMEQHAVPQHIASFEFKLFGDLTVRQFVTLAIPMAAAAALFFSGLPAVIRIPISAVIALFGLFSALVPIGGRPFDKWIVSFIKAVLSPTQRIWVKESKIPAYLNVVITQSNKEQQAPEPITAQGRERLKNYLRTLPRGNVNPLDVKEQIAVQRLSFDTIQQEANTLGGKLQPPIIWPTQNAFVPKTLPQAPAQEEQYEQEMRASLPQTKSFHQTATPILSTHAKPYALPGLEKKLKNTAQEEEAIELAPIIKAQLATEAQENIIPIQTPGKRLRLIHGIGKTRTRKLHFAPPEGFDISKLPIRGERRFEISEELKKRYTKDTNTDSLFPQETILPKIAPIPTQNPQSLKAHTPNRQNYIPRAQTSTNNLANVEFKPQEKEVQDSQVSTTGEPSQKVPQLTAALANMMPITTTPNVLSGIVTDSQKVPMAGAIVIVKDPNNIPIRALKTNKLGQFLSVTPLSENTYTIETEAQGHSFVPQSIKLEGKILEPLEIKAAEGVA